MRQNNRLDAKVLSVVLSLSAIAVFALLLLVQTKSAGPASSSAGYPAPSTPSEIGTDATPALPVEFTAWWKLTEVADMATRSAEATPYTGFATDIARGPSDPVPLVFLRRPAGDGVLVVHAAPYWYNHLHATSAWVTRTAEKYITVYVGLYLTESINEVQVVVEFASLKDYSLLDNGKIYSAPIQDASLAIVDLTGHTLILHSASGETVWFDAFAQTFSTPDARSTMEVRSVGAGKVIESSAVDFAIPRARVFNSWSVPTSMTTLEVYAGDINDFESTALSFGRGAVFIREIDPASGAQVVPIVIEAPDFFGALRVFTAVEDKLVLVDARGNAFVLDPQARKFLPVISVQLPLRPFYDGLDTH